MRRHPICNLTPRPISPTGQAATLYRPPYGDCRLAQHENSPRKDLPLTTPKRLTETVRFSPKQCGSPQIPQKGNSRYGKPSYPFEPRNHLRKVKVLCLLDVKVVFAGCFCGCFCFVVLRLSTKGAFSTQTTGRGLLRLPSPSTPAVVPGTQPRRKERQWNTLFSTRFPSH